MMTFAKKAMRRFAQSEEGSMVVPVALWTPVFLGLILATVELGTITIRHTALERAMDDTVRDVRLGNGAEDHAELKQAICNSAKVLPNCDTTLKLEMVRLNMRAWQSPKKTADCYDEAEPYADQRTFDKSGDQDLMYLRACYKYKPITPAGWLGSNLAKDNDGYAALTSKSAFVVEPR